MALEVNSHVSRLRRFQPFHPDSSELIFEQSDTSEPGFETVALQHLLGVIDDDAVRLVVLTGDAGHGKTTLCARVLEQLGLDPAGAKELIKSRGDGREPIATTRGGRPLRVVKDLSDLDVAEGGQLLADLLSSTDGSVSIVCANEGRLRRAVAATDGADVRVITQTLERGMRVGQLAGVVPAIEVLNLNYQSVAPEDQRGLLDWALRSWSTDRRRWQICTRCDANTACPIYANHRDLADSDSGERRRDGIRSLFSTAERAGAVVTTRQALATVSFAITGGLSCVDVHRRWERGPNDGTWQFEFLFHQAVFGDRLTREQRTHVPSLDAIRRLDPGAVALRAVDDGLEPADDSPFLPPLPALDEGTPQSRRDAQRESDTLRSLMRFLRRRDFFDGSQTPTRLTRMGWQSGQAFVDAAGGRVADVGTRDELLRGLEAVQGVHRRGQPPDFLVLDPAFVAHRSRAAVVARRIPSRVVRVVPQMEQWRLQGDVTPDLPAAIEWLDREVVLRFEDDVEPVAIPVDLHRFELLFRWGSGLSSRHQHEAEIRHLTSALARLVPTSESGEEIIVLVGGERRTLTIDVGERIRSGEG